jgi:transposase
MESHEVLRKVFEKVSPKAIAAELGISLSLVYKWAEKPSADGSGSRNPLDRIAALMELSQDEAIVEWLCQQAGGCFLRNPDSSCKQGFEVLPATHEIISQFSQMLSMISAAALDNSISSKEASEIRDSWDKLKSYAEGFVRCCEEGDFDQLRRIPKPSEGPKRLLR